LPVPGVLVGFRYAGAAALLEGTQYRAVSSAGLVGLRTSVRRMRSLAGGGIVVVRFNELGAAAFFDEPLNEVFGRMVGLEELDRRKGLAEVQARLGEARSHAERVALVDGYLCGRLRELTFDPLVHRAVGAIAQRDGALRIGALAKELGTSRDPLEKRFRRWVGATPKQLCSILRVQRVVSGFGRGASLTELAQSAGYFDQSHLIREFRAFTGEPPERFLRTTTHW